MPPSKKTDKKDEGARHAERKADPRYRLKVRKKHVQAFQDAFVVANMATGHGITMHDDGVTGDGDPAQARRAAIKKLGQMDDYGDPLFVFVHPVPEFILKGDAEARTPYERISFLARTIDEPSRHPDFETLGDRLDANESAYVQRDLEQKEERQRTNVVLALPPKLKAQFEQLGDILAAKADQEGLGKVAAQSGTTEAG